MNGTKPFLGYCVIVGILLIGLLTGCENTNSANQTASTMPTSAQVSKDAPKAKKLPKTLSIHGDDRVDNYYWLNDREDQEVIDYLTAENTYTTSMMAHTEQLQEELYDEIVSRIKQDDTSVPYRRRGYYYITRYEEGKEYPIFTRKKGSMEAEEEVMVNVNTQAVDFDYYNVSGLSVSQNNQLLAYGEDTLSRRIYTIRFKNLDTGEMLDDVIPNTTGRAIWANDNKTVFYSVKDKALRSYKIFKHKLGTDVSQDVEVYHEEDETFSAYVYKSKSGKYIIIASWATLSNEYHILNADTPDEDFRVFQPRVRNLEYNIAHLNDRFYVRTNMDAQNFRLMSTGEEKTSKENWEEVVPHRKDILLEGMDLFDDYLVLSERKEGITQIRVLPWEGGEEYYIDFGEDAYVAYTSINPELDTEVLRVGYQSMTTPNSTYDFNMRTKEKTLLKQQEIVGNFDPANYQSERIYAKVRDGVSVPISIVYRKGFKKDGQAPLMLYAYGSYGNSMEPYFSSIRLSLLDRGFVYAIAHIRGGEEMGRYWYEDGKLLKKKNTFFDFIDCAEHLVANQYTNQDKLFAMGGSAGGLLMGAVVNYRPDLFKGVVAAVPFVDVVTTMLDESIPLTTGEFDEWGNPKDKEYYDYIKSYSPYDNVAAKDYPKLLLTTGLHDSQVQYWEPAKWVAKLRDLKTDDNSLLLHTNMDAGHGGASGRFRRHKETAMQYAFIIDLAGLNDGALKN